MDFWDERPPANEMLQIVAACLGWKPPQRDSGPIKGVLGEITEEEAKSFLRLINGEMN